MPTPGPWITPASRWVDQVWDWRGLLSGGQLDDRTGAHLQGEQVRGTDSNLERLNEPTNVMWPGSVEAWSSREGDARLNGYAGSSYLKASRLDGDYWPADQVEDKEQLVSEFILAAEWNQPQPDPEIPGTWPEGAIGYEISGDDGVYSGPTVCTVGWSFRSARPHGFGSNTGHLARLPQDVDGFLTDESVVDTPGVWTVLDSLADPAPGVYRNNGPGSSAFVTVEIETRRLPLGLVIPEAVSSLTVSAHPASEQVTKDNTRNPDGSLDIRYQMFGWYTAGARVTQFSARRVLTPRQYRWIYADAPAGMWRLRQRQSAGAADGWSLRHRQNSNMSGSWPLRQRQDET